MSIIRAEWSVGVAQSVPACTSDRISTLNLELSLREVTTRRSTQHSQGIPNSLPATMASNNNMLERRKKDEQVRATIHQKLIDTGEKDRLKNLLRAKLEECGWRDELKNYCKEVIKNKGLEKITVEELVAEITPRGRATVPSAIKAELLQRIRKFLTQN